MGCVFKEQESPGAARVACRPFQAGNAERLRDDAAGYPATVFRVRGSVCFSRCVFTLRLLIAGAELEHGEREAGLLQPGFYGELFEPGGSAQGVERVMAPGAPGEPARQTRTGSEHCLVLVRTRQRAAENVWTGSNDLKSLFPGYGTQVHERETAKARARFDKEHAGPAALLTSVKESGQR